jgi:hypothetical protein
MKSSICEPWPPQDQDLAEISQGVATLNQIAIGMQEELKVQEAMIGDIESKVDDASRHLNATNRRLVRVLGGFEWFFGTFGVFLL